MREVFASVALDVKDVRRHPDQECIVLKAGEQLVEYEDNDDTRAMRERLRAYNALLLRTFIDIPSLDHPFIDRPITTGPDEGRIDRVATTDDQKFVRRIFSRGRWDLNGRFYGPWWQQVGKDWRSQIHIDDQPTVEIDFKGLHVNLLSLEEGVVIDGDPYQLPGPVFSGIPPDLQREVVKTLVLKAINAATKMSAFSSFRQDWPTGHVAKKLTNEQLSGLLDLFLEKHPHLSGKLCNDHGIRLMFVDSCITDQVLSVATRFDTPVLGIHDSFIVARDNASTVSLIIDVAARENIGSALKVEVTGSTSSPVRSDGYRARLAAHRTRLA